MDDTYLYHHGVKGMKWGRRLYQNKDGSLTPLGRMRYRTDKGFKTQVNRQRSLEKARQTRLANKKHAEDKDRVVKSGSASELLKYKGELTQQEMTSAWNRIQWEQNIKSVADKESSAGKSKVDSALNKIGDLTNKSQTVIKAYNTVANIHNAFNLNSMMPKIETNITNGNRNERKAEKKEQKKAAEAKAKRAEQESQRDTKREERAKKREEQPSNTSNNPSSSSESKTYTGTVSGEGKSKRTEQDAPIMDAEWREVSPERISTGESYVTKLLDSPEEDDK